MKTFFVLAVLVTVAFATKHRLHNHHPKSDEEEDHHHKEFKCRGEPIVHSEEFKTYKQECRKEIPRKEEEAEGKKHGRACRLFCLMTKQGGLDEQGLIVEAKMKSLINHAIVNQEARQEIEEEVIDCGRNATGLGIATSDHKCSNYNGYFKCMWMSIIESCVDPFANQGGEEE